MSDFTWALAVDGSRLLDGGEEAPDGKTPDEGEPTTGNIALVMEGCALYGSPAELLQFLADGIAKVSAHLAGRDDA